MSGNPKMALKLKYLSKQKSFISKCSWNFQVTFYQQILLIKLFCLMRYFNFVAIFELPDIDLVFEFFISAQLADLKKSASSTVRPKL